MMTLQMDQAEDLYEEIDALLEHYRRETDKSVLHEVCYY